MAFPTGYTLYQEVTVDSAQVDANLTDFPIYIDLSDLSKAGADIFDTCLSDGGDIRVTKSDGTTELAREIVVIDTSGKTGEMHVKFDGTLSSSSDTTIRIWYNGSDAEPAEDATYGREAVWSDYDGVWHLQEDPSGSAPQMMDSTANDNDGTSGGTMLTGDSVAAVIEKGLNFDGTDDEVDVGEAFFDGTPASKTLSIWANIPTDGLNGNKPGPLFSKGAGGNGYEWYITKTGGTTRHRMVIDSSTIEGTADGWSYATDTFFCCAFGTTNLQFYIDGATDAGSQAFTYAGDNNTNANIGAQGVSHFNIGVLDEMRIADMERASTWISTEYNNQSSPGTFYSTSDEISASADNPGTFFPYFY